MIFFSLFLQLMENTKKLQLTDWLPTTNKEVKLRGWTELDVILFSGDAYVDHPSFGPAVIGRILESYGLRVAIVPQPSVTDDLQDFEKLGKPRLFFGATGGCMDPMERWCSCFFRYARSRLSNHVMH